MCGSSRPAFKSRWGIRFRFYRSGKNCVQNGDKGQSAGTIRAHASRALNAIVQIRAMWPVCVHACALRTKRPCPAWLFPPGRIRAPQTRETARSAADRDNCLQFRRRQVTNVRSNTCFMRFFDVIIQSLIDLPLSCLKATADAGGLDYTVGRRGDARRLAAKTERIGPAKPPRDRDGASPFVRRKSGRS